MHPTRRKMAPETVAQARADYALRRNAEQMLGLARDILAKTPTHQDHARRAGVHESTIRRAVTGVSFKDVPFG